MDIPFTCPNCKQQLEADSALSGSSINCPACNAIIVIPAADTAAHRTPVPAGHGDDKHFVVPVSESPTQSLIQKPRPPLDIAAKTDGSKQMRVRTIRRTECVEVGRDRFDEIVSDFLQKVGEINVVSVNSINYSVLDIGSQKILTDYGVLIIYKG